MKTDKYINLFDKYLDKFIDYLPIIVTSLILLLLGIWLIRLFTKKVKKSQKYQTFDPSVAYFTITALKISLYVLLFITIASLLGIPMTSVIAILGSIGIALGLAMQSHISNIAAAIEILILKQLQVGDYVQISEYNGTVKQIRMFYTIINTIDNRQVIIPNNLIVNNTFINYTKENFRKIDLLVGIGYSSSIIQAKEVILQLISEDQRIINEPEPPMVAVSELANSSVNLVIRAWTKTEDMLDVKFTLLERIKTEFDNKGIEIPFQQRVVYLRNEQERKKT
jgi:small conductance mechanosensitive channel